jgi:hypothetical protein
VTCGFSGAQLRLFSGWTFKRNAAGWIFGKYSLVKMIFTTMYLEKI